MYTNLPIKKTLTITLTSHLKPKRKKIHAIHAFLITTIFILTFKLLKDLNMQATSSTNTILSNPSLDLGNLKTDLQRLKRVPNNLSILSELLKRLALSTKLYKLQVLKLTQSLPSKQSDKTDLEQDHSTTFSTPPPSPYKRQKTGTFYTSTDQPTQEKQCGQHINSNELSSSDTLIVSKTSTQLSTTASSSTTCPLPICQEKISSNSSTGTWTETCIADTTMHSSQLEQGKSSQVTSKSKGRSLVPKIPLSDEESLRLYRFLVHVSALDNAQVSPEWELHERQAFKLLLTELSGLIQALI